MELTSLLYFAYAILGIGIIIFIHELGHFLAAKKVGVRVETFCLGFDPVIRGRRLRLFSFQKGDTVYAIGAIPFGGYVKMAGETILDRKAGSPPPRSDELLGKSPGARAMVFAAGAIFNILSAILFFILAFSVGVSFIAPTIGQVDPGKPAWEAGVRTGDRVVEIDGKKVVDFHEIAISSALGNPDAPRTYLLERDGKTFRASIRPVWSPEYGFNAIGVSPAVNPVVRRVEEGTAAGRAGLLEGDRIVELELDGVRVRGPHFWQELDEFSRIHPGRPIRMGVERAGRPDVLWLEIRQERKPDPKPLPLLGVMPAGNVVVAVQPGTPAAAALAVGDRIVAAGGKALGALDWLSLRDTLGLSGPVELKVESIAGELRSVQVDAADLIRWSLLGDFRWWHFGARVAQVLPASPLAGVLKEGDLVVAVGKERQPVLRPDALARQLPSSVPTVLTVRRDGKTIEVQASIPPGAEDLGLTWETMPPVRVTDGSPASKAGIVSGSRIDEIAGRRIGSWADLQAAVRGAAPESVAVKWTPPALPGEIAAPRQASVDLRSSETASAYEEMGMTLTPLEAKVQANILESFTLGAKRTVIVAQDVFLTLKGLLSRQVEAKNLAGPVGIINLIYRVSEYGFGTLIYYLALISVNLGLFNLLPFPILDGGHLLFLGIEKVKGSPVDVRIQEIVTTVAVFLIIGLALFVTYNDLVRLIKP